VAANLGVVFGSALGGAGCSRGCPWCSWPWRSGCPAGWAARASTLCRRRP